MSHNNKMLCCFGLELLLGIEGHPAIGIMSNGVGMPWDT